MQHNLCAWLSQVEYAGVSAFNVLALNESVGPDVAPFNVLQMADGNKGVYRDPYDPDPARRYKLVGNFQRNDSIIPTSTSSAPGFNSEGYPPFVNQSWKNYHFGSASSPDGVTWHSYHDMSMQVKHRYGLLVFGVSQNSRILPARMDMYLSCSTRCQ